MAVGTGHRFIPFIAFLSMIHLLNAKPPGDEVDKNKPPTTSNTVSKFKLNEAELRDWITSDPIAQAILSQAENSPERDLFVDFLERTYQVLRDEKTTIQFSGIDSKGLLFSLSFGIASSILRSPPSETLAHPYPKYLGLIMQLQFMAMDSVSGQIPHMPFNRFMGGIQFILQAVASGHTDIESIRILAAKTEVVVTDELRSKQTTQKMTATELLKVLEAYGVPLSLDGVNLAPHWRYWNVHDRSVFESEPKFRMSDHGPTHVVTTRQPNSIFDSLAEQIRPKNRPEATEQLFNEWMDRLRSNLNWKLHFPEHADLLTNEQKLEIIRTIIQVIEPNPTKYSRSVDSALTKLPYLKQVRLDTRKTRALWRDIFETSLPIIYELNPKKRALDLALKAEEAEAEKKAREIKAQEARQKQIEAEKLALQNKADKVIQKMLDALYTNDRNTTFLSLHATSMLEIYKNSIIEGRSLLPDLNDIPEPAESSEAPAKVLQLIASGIQAEQDHDPVLKAHLKYLEDRAEKRLKRNLSEKEKTMIRELQVLIFTKRIEQFTDTTSKLQIRPEQIQDLVDLGLYTTSSPSPAQLETDRLKDPFRLYRTPSLHLREGESDAKVLKRAAARAKDMTTADPTRLAVYLFKRMLVFEADFINFIDNPALGPLTEDELEDFDLKAIEIQYAHFELFRALKILVNKNPETPKEFQSHLMDSKLLKGITGHPEKIILPEWMAAQIMNQAQFIMHAMTYPSSCREAILGFVK